MEKDIDDIETISKTNRNNSRIILHYRNIYAFIASVADQVINRTED